MMAPFLIFLAGLATSLGAGPDSVKLVDGGKVLEGRVVFEGKDEIVLRSGRKDDRIARKDIAEIHSLERSLSPIIDQDLRGAEAAKMQALAEECEKAGLANEARILWLRVLLADPKNDAAVKALKAQRVKEEVNVELGKDRRKLSELGKKQESWKDSYELDTTHFVLRSDLDLPFVLDLATGLERFHRRFYETLGSPLELYIFDESPEVYVYGQAKDFPVAPLRGDPIWYTPGENRLNVLAEPLPSIEGVVQELSKLMMFNALRRSSGSTGQVPMWTAFGIAHMFGKAAPKERFGPWSDIATPDSAAFALAQRANVPFDKLFNSSANDFNADAKRDEMNASAYTLVHYLVFAKDGALREGYGRFLREGAKGKISIGALTDTLGISKKEIEEGWRAHVAANAK